MKLTKILKFNDGKLRVDFVNEFRESISFKDNKYINSCVDKMYEKFPMYNKQDIKKFLQDFFISFIEEMLYNNRISFASLYDVEMMASKQEIFIKGKVRKSSLTGDNKKCKKKKNLI
jgi:hypothetical protein